VIMSGGHEEEYIQHRTDRDHVCDEHSGRRPCAQVTF